MKEHWVGELVIDRLHGNSLHKEAIDRITKLAADNDRDDVARYIEIIASLDQLRGARCGAQMTSRAGLNPRPALTTDLQG
jgi:hypothetical protein